MIDCPSSDVRSLSNHILLAPDVRKSLLALAATNGKLYTKYFVLIRSTTTEYHIAQLSLLWREARGLFSHRSWISFFLEVICYH